MNDDAIIPDHESPVRRMVADAKGTEYRAFRTLKEAREHGDAVAILQGDWGGQIYVVAPVDMIECSMESLHRLLLDLDGKAWACNENEGASLYFEHGPPGTAVAGGMGGGASTGDIWSHPEFESIADQIREVLADKRERVRFNEDRVESYSLQSSCAVRKTLGTKAVSPRWGVPVTICSSPRASPWAFESRPLGAARIRGLGRSVLVFRASDLFRISGFGFRVSSPRQALLWIAGLPRCDLCASVVQTALSLVRIEK